MSKYKSKSSGMFSFVAVLLIAALLCGVLTKGFTNWNPFGWFDEKQQVEEETKVVDENGNDLSDGKVHPMPRNIMFTSASSPAVAPTDATLGDETIIF